MTIEKGPSRTLLGGYVAPGVREVVTETVFYEHEPMPFSDECRASCKGCAAKRAAEAEREERSG